MSDEAFERRHRKWEQLEKRRKRQDREQALLALHHQQETAAYLGQPAALGPAPKVAKPAKAAFESFFPDPLTHLKVIEVTDQLPLVAWGQPVPEFESETFSLPKDGPYSFQSELDFVGYHRNPTADEDKPSSSPAPTPSPPPSNRSSTPRRTRSSVTSAPGQTKHDR